MFSHAHNWFNFNSFARSFIFKFVSFGLLGLRSLYSYSACWEYLTGSWWWFWIPCTTGWTPSLLRCRWPGHPGTLRWPSARTAAGSPRAIRKHSIFSYLFGEKRRIISLQGSDSKIADGPFFWLGILQKQWNCFGKECILQCQQLKISGAFHWGEKQIHTHTGIAPAGEKCFHP